jgi:alpha-1,6-mannosyltransferase
VTEEVGRLGPVGDAHAMSHNILDLWNADREAMAGAARAQALEFSWDRSMEALFGRLYPAAFARRAERRVDALAASALAA